jgi:hypothetical protein
MQKTTSSLKKTDLSLEKNQTLKNQQLQPKAATLQKILQFAASYRAQQIGTNQFVDLLLN